MDVKIGSRWRDVIDAAVESGRYASEEDFINEGLRLAAEKERRFHELKVSLEAALEEEGEYSPADVAAYVEDQIASWDVRKAAE